MLDSGSEAASLACGCLAAAMNAVVEAHEFGIREGLHRQPWAESFVGDGVRVYVETLPVWYMREVASLIEQCLEVLETHRVPARHAEDWLIVIQFMHNARDALVPWGRGLDRVSAGPRPGAEPMTEGRLPSILRVDRLAALTTTEGARRLAGAARIVRRQLKEESVVPLTDEQRRLLKAVASGRPVADLAEELGYSRRSMYRRLSRLWQQLGVAGAVAGIHKATAEGLLD